jgi:ammonia channel protein AmtB
VIVGLIATGSMAERTRLEPLLLFIVFLNIIVYPPVLAWAWNL